MQAIVIVLIAVILGYGIHTFRNVILQEMDRFEIDFSQIPHKTIVITGGNSGLGLETARVLTKAGANVILACRSLERCEAAKTGILQEVKEGKVHCLPLELSSLTSVRDFVTLFQQQFGAIDILINNAGLSLHDRRESVDGLEMQMHANHLGHFLLTSLLFPLFNQNGRIINHSSSMHFLVWSKSSVSEDFLSERDYSLASTYSKTKLVNLLFTFELNRRLAAQGNPKQLKSIAVHPGFTATNLQKEKFPLWQQINEYLAMKVRHGAQAQIYAAADPRAQASVNSYFGAKFIGFGVPEVSSVSSLAKDQELQRYVWDISKKLTGNSFHDL